MENRNVFEIKNIYDLSFIKVGMKFGSELYGIVGEILDFEAQDNPIADGNGDIIVTDVKFKLLENEEVFNFGPHTFIAFVKDYKFIQPIQKETEIESEKKLGKEPINTKNLIDKQRLLINLSSSETPKYYDNSKGSLYKFAEDHNLNSWEFDIIKRITRCRKKGAFKEDLEKTKVVIDLYLKEYIEK
jgi:hypothetical protein